MGISRRTALTAGIVVAAQIDVGVSLAATVAAYLMTPSSDATDVLQAAINAQAAAGGGLVHIPAGTWNVTGLTLGPNVSIRGDGPGTNIRLTANSAAFYGAGLGGYTSISDLTVTGSAPAWDGSSVNVADSGQSAVHLYNCPNVRISNVAARNIAGSAFDFEHPASAFSAASDLSMAGLQVTNSYRAFRTRNSAEYITFTGCRARNNIFGAVIESGNVTFTGFLFEYNYTNIQIIGRSNANPAHATFAGGKSNHAYYNLDAISCGVGTSFTGVDFIGDPGGSLNVGGSIRIANSRGISIVGGSMGSNIAVSKADPMPGSPVTAGPNILQGSFIRDDIVGFTTPSMNYPGGLLIKGNYDGSGLVGWNN
jgi:hypothetical protein